VFVDALELRDLGFDGVDPAATGRPAYHPSRLCEKSVVQSACRTSVSVSSIRKPIALATSVRRRQLRKQFCASLAHVTFHTAWVINGHRPAARWWLMHGIYLSVDFR
jgi:hypothetical protein